MFCLAYLDLEYHPSLLQAQNGLNLEVAAFGFIGLCSGEFASKWYLIQRNTPKRRYQAEFISSRDPRSCFYFAPH